MTSQKLSDVNNFLECIVKGLTSVDDRQKVLNTAVTTNHVHMKILLRFIIQYIIKKTMTFLCYAKFTPQHNKRKSDDFNTKWRQYSLWLDTTALELHEQASFG
jgi:hypothetical protein